MHVEAFRNELRRMLRQAPFQPFVLSFAGGERAIIEHPENIAFDPRPGGSSDFYILTSGLRMFSSFEAVSSASMLTESINGQAEQAET